MAELDDVTPVFAVADIGATIRWYEEQLGFTGYPFPPQGPYVFAIMKRNKIEIMLQRVKDYEKPDIYDSRDGGVWDAYFTVTGVKDFFESIRERVRIVQPLCKQPYGTWQFEVADLNGYVLVFGEEAA